ncbi:MAG: hypothetical protein LBC79_08920 [Deltaproteobacteria bacterium]|jgi:hypothetical protein|nr:hypothetical protein [Deltaproteobacteria bacterium]
MRCFWNVFRFRRAGTLAACLLACCCTGLFAAFAHAAAPAAPQKAKAQPKNAVRSGWAFQMPDRSAQNARWHESLSATLQNTTFAPSAPAGRYLRHSPAAPGKRLPPTRLDDLDTMLPPEKTPLTLGDKTPIHGEFSRERISWRQHNDAADTFGATPALKEERRAGAYAGFYPSEDVEIKLGPEYNLGTSVQRPDQTGNAKDSAGSFGMGMKLKIDF